MVIRKTLKFAPLDSNGYIINIASIRKVSSKWKKAVDYSILLLTGLYSDDLDSVYLRGSVATGDQNEHNSDLDLLVFLKRDKFEKDYEYFNSINKRVRSKYPFIERVDIIADNRKCILDNLSYQVIIKTQSVCVYGTDVCSNLPHFTPNQAIFHVQRIKQDIVNFQNFFEENPKDNELIKAKCKTIMKRIVRTGFELVVDQSSKYTRDLYTCYFEFIKYYPDQRKDMHKALMLSINPTNNVETILGILNRLGNQIILEVDHIK